MAGAAAVVTTLNRDTQNSLELFVGRDEQVEQLLDLLDPAQSHAVAAAVAGMGGIGKTALARHTGALAVEQGWFPGGAVFVDLRGYDLDDDQVLPHQVFGPMLRILGVPGEQIPATADEQATVYHQVLHQLAERGYRVLVVLDNASTGKQVYDLLPRHWAHRALITTRDTLVLPTAQQLDLDVLATDDAMSLLTKILTRRRPSDQRVALEQNAAMRLVTACGALPLAVEITGSILADDPDFTITDLAAELTAVGGLGVHRVRHGDRAMATVFDLSWRWLQVREPAAAGLLPLLTLNPGPDFHTDAAAALAGHPPTQVASWLRVLRQASLLRRTGGRWSMHDVIRLHARDHTPNHDRDAATRRLLEHYERNANAADAHLWALPRDPVPDRFSGRQDALDWFDTERANLTAAVALALDTSHHDLTRLLAIDLRVYLDWRRHFNDQVTVSEHALAAAQNLDTPRALADAWDNLGASQREVGRFDEAITAHRQAVAIYRELGDRYGEGGALSNLGLTLHEVGRFDEAITGHQQAVAICRELGDRRSEGVRLDNLGASLRKVGRFNEAITGHQQAVAICRELGDRDGEGRALDNLGLTLHEVGRFDEAITAHQQDLAICRERGNRHGEGCALDYLGLALRDADRRDEAITAHRQAVAIYRELGDRYGEGGALSNLGLTLHELGRFDEAITGHQQAAVIFRGLGDRHGEGCVLNCLGLALRDADRRDEAKDTGRKAMAAFRETGDTHAEGIVTEWLDDLL